MKLPEMKTGLTISALAHAALLLWGLISFSARPLEAAPKGLPVDIISEKEFTELAKGVKNAEKQEKPKPLVEKIGDPKPVEDSSAKVSEKREIKAAKAEAAPPPMPPPMPEPRPAKAKPEKKPPPKVDPIAETLKKQEAKKKAEEKAKAKAKAAEHHKRQQPKFDPNKIAALLDKREPRRQASVGDTLTSTPSLGYANGPAAQLSQSELDALRRRLVQCWNPPVGAANVANMKVVLRVLFNRDGSVASQPAVVAGTASTYGPAMAESAKRAILSCQPFTMLKPAHYEQWKDIEITFDPRDMFGG